MSGFSFPSSRASGPLARSPNRRFWSLRRALVCSLLFHLFTPLLVSRCDRARAWLSAGETEKPEAIAPPIVFEIIEAPSGPEPDEVPPTSLASTRKSLARSESPPVEGENELPRSEGDSPLLESGADGGETSVDGEQAEETPPAPAQGEPAPPAEEGGSPRPTLPLSGAEMRREIARSLDQRREYENPRGSSAIPGDLSFNTVDFEFAPYLLLLKERIEEKWYPPVAFRGGLPYRGETVARFMIERDGRLSSIERIRGADHPSLDTAALNAVRFAAPFPPLPDGFPEERWVITCTFYYR